MKLISLLVAACFTMNVFASTGTLQQFERALDEYHYALSVEWDQKDAKFQEKVTNEFFKDVQKLMNDKGLTQAQIVSLVEKRVNNKAQVDALKLRMSLMSEARTPEELAKAVREASADFYSNGASWNSTATVAVSVVLVAVAALGIAMWYSATHGCQEYAQTCDWAGCRNDYDNCVDHGYIGPHL